MKKILSLLILLSVAVTFGQESNEDVVKKLIKVESDTIKIDSLSINPGYFEMYDAEGVRVPNSQYVVDYAKALLWFGDSTLFLGKTIQIEYLPYPEFLTKTYSAFDRSLIVSEATDQSNLYSSNTKKQVKNNKPFEGLYTSGSLSRGVTIGSNQDAVVNSNFNLQIEGKLSEKVGIRASITDNEIPLQSGGFTQRLDEFDQVFIELFSDNWSLTAGDIDLLNTENYLMRFQKKISGVLVKGKIDKPLATTDFFASGALVRGKFRSYKFVGIDGNQGPYKILGEDNQQYIIMISGSERVYANGVLLRRGENFDYTIDYNTGEIRFTTLYTVTSNLRFTVEYQLSERNYTRFLTYDGVGFKSEKLRLGIKYFNETDAKNSPLDQNLSDEQKQILAEAGDDKSKMVSPSEVEAEYNENRILYKKIIINGKEIYEFSNDPDDELYQVTFSYVGENNGDYNLETTLAAGRVYQYVPEFNNQKQGAYLPVVQLIAPEKYQMLHVEADYNPGEKTLIASEFALSDNDQNLFSSIDNENNKGFAAKASWKQGIIDKKWKLNSELDYEYFSKDFVSIERIRNVEFTRDWNILSRDLSNLGEQNFLRGGLELNRDSVGTFNYRYEYLSLGEDYKGDRHNLQANLQLNQTKILFSGSSMKNENLVEKNSFDRLYTSVIQQISRYWIGAKFNYEKNQIQNVIDQSLNELSHGFSELEGFAGVGDSSNVFVEVGYNFRLTDSVQNEFLSEVNRSHTYFLKSRLIQNANTDLSVFANYRNVQNINIQNENSLNARLAYRQRIFRDFISLQTLLETNSGTLPQQEFSYVEVEPGKGFYEWIDFNNNGIQELDEFVVARFQDQAIYVRVLLPTVSFLRTNQNKWSQSINLNGSGWRNEEGLKKLVSHFSNQTYFLIDVKTKRDGDDFTITPFAHDEEDLLGMDQNFKNSLFFNRGMQRYSFVYTYLNFRKKTIFSFGDQDVSSYTHQFQFIHKLGSSWLLDFNAGLSNTQSESVSYSNRNYKLDQYDFNPKLSYLYDQNTRLELFYKFKDKENTIGAQETLQMHVGGLNFNYAGKRGFSLNSNFNLYLNDFVGSTNSPVAYQMLEGLQPGTNLTWLLGMQKRLTSFLDLNLNYSGRKSENSDTIHTGNIQLRATF
ncbi:hypothetical protein LCM02_01695 [Lutimonas saemankumensis]|uniref:hypothetical protein n=1 Tax=Lutimonas saemankumensis TaxID=483016 RepID=UPI001CD2F5FA|nr:hypothetical protein [Lutimonas saemankumensis]MCA0931144.1 hypothetical protein [Lutimonas saemankumensis]